MPAANRRATYLLILSEREAVGWVLANERMAFPRGRAHEASALRPGDVLLVYTTRGCFHNPTRDRGRVIGEAKVASAVTELDELVTIAGRTFTHGCDIRLLGLAPPREGLELSPLVPQLETFPDERAWSVRLRRPLLRLTGRDADLVRRKLRSYMRSPSEELAGYLDLATSVPR